MPRWLVWLLVLGFLSYYVYIPLPSDIDSPIASGIFAFFTRELFRWAQIAEDFGYQTQAENARGLLESISRLAYNPLINSGQITVEDSVFDGVPIKMYHPKSRNKRAALVYIHGGGWSILSPASYGMLTSYLASELQVPVISIGYRLAPNHPFPAAYQDSLAATAWFIENANQFGVDADRIAIMGDSAGGNLAAAVSQELTFNRNIPRLKFQCLVYPTLQAINLNLPSFQQNDYPFLYKSLMARFLSYYIKGFDSRELYEAMMNGSHVTNEFMQNALVQSRLDQSLIPASFKSPKYSSFAARGGDRMSAELRSILLDPSFSPLLSSNLSGLPPAYIVTTGFDVLRDDGILYANRLAEVGVEVTWKNYPSGFHGMMMYTFFGYSPFKSSLESFNDFVNYANINL